MLKCRERERVALKHSNGSLDIKVTLLSLNYKYLGSTSNMKATSKIFFVTTNVTLSELSAQLGKKGGFEKRYMVSSGLGEGGSML